MAFRNLEVVVTIKDNASRQLDKLNKNIKNTGKSAKETNVDFTKFNRTLFSTAAFVGTFIKAFNSLSNSLDQGSELDRLSNQFERVMGPKGKVFDAIKSMTDNSVDKMETMRQGLSLANLGIIRDGGQLANIVSKAGTAAKLAGKDSAEGIKAYSEFLKTGEISNLQFLDQIAKTNPALQAQMAILQKAGGVMGTVVSTQARLALGNSLLETTTKKALKGQRDFRDAILDIKQNFSIFRLEIGRLLLTALAPFIEKFAILFEKLAKGIDYIRQHEKNLVFLIKAFIVGTGAVLGFTAAMGTLRLTIIALSSIGFGLPKLIASILLIGSTFLGVTNKADKFIDRLKIFGAFIKGIWQLISSFDEKTGISQIDESLKKMLEDAGIYDLVKNISRAALVVGRVAKDIGNAILFISNTIDSAFGGAFRSILNFIGGSKQAWSKFWIEDTPSIMQKGLRIITVLGATLAAWGGFKLLKGLLSGTLGKLPVIGKFFGGGKGPKGTPSDPMYVKNVGGIGGSEMLEAMIGAKGLEKSGKIFSILKGLLGKPIGKLTEAFTKLILKSNYLSGLFNNQVGLFGLLKLVLKDVVLRLLSLPRLLISGIAYVVPRLIAGYLLPAFAGLKAGLISLLSPIGLLAGSLAILGYAIYKWYGIFKGMDWNDIKEMFGMGKHSKQYEEFEKDPVKAQYEHAKKMGWTKPAETLEQYKTRVEEKDKKGTVGPIMSTIPVGENKTSTNPLMNLPKSEVDALDILGTSLEKTKSSEAYQQQLNIEKALDKGQKPTELLNQKQAYEAFVAALEDSKNMSDLAEAFRRRTFQTNPLSSRESTTNYP